MTVLVTCIEFCADFALNPRRQIVVVLFEVGADGSGIAYRQRSKCPGHRLDHHVVAVGDEQVAGLERAPSIARAATRLQVQGHRADEGRALPPAVV